MRTATCWARPQARLLVDRVEPPDGATQVFRDAPVVLRLSRPVDPSSVSAETFRIQDPEGPVPGSVRVSPDRRVVIWGGERPLRAGAVHFVEARGLRDSRGCLVPPHLSRFVPCDLARDDIME